MATCSSFLKNTIDRLPEHLKCYVVEQNYESYTPVNHAVWRYIMRQNYNFLSKTAHKSYVNGLKKTGISIEQIPDICDMNEILYKIGWGAVCVDGFIPPAAFMEFQALNILVIAADIRHISHIKYTPAPDIVHEAAGHAPIIADPEYAEYLRLFGEIGSKALPSKADNDLYEAIRKLSILKETPDTSDEDIAEAEEQIFKVQENMGELSEMSRIRNLHWWTVEYGLIGSIDEPKIYGAGLLSSIGESVSCLKDDVAKIPYNLHAADVSFDITKPQPQLFVTQSFSYLTEILNEFADTMGLRTGGTAGIQKAIDSGTITTCEYSSGLQVSGNITDFIVDSMGEPAYIKTSGPTILCEKDKLLIGHEKRKHAEGYGSPVGKIIGHTKELELMTIGELKSNHILIGKKTDLKFESGVRVYGKLQQIRKNAIGKILLMTFENCTVTYEDKILFHPDWGVYDMAIGSKIISVYAGPADKDAYDSTVFISQTGTVKLIDKHPELSAMYSKVRSIRENNTSLDSLEEIFKDLKSKFPKDWLLVMEIYELVYKSENTTFKNSVKEYLEELKITGGTEISGLISDGLRLLK